MISTELSYDNICSQEIWAEWRSFYKYHAFCTCTLYFAQIFAQSESVDQSHPGEQAAVRWETLGTRLTQHPLSARPAQRRFSSGLANMFYFSIFFRFQFFYPLKNSLPFSILIWSPSNYNIFIIRVIVRVITSFESLSRRPPGGKNSTNTPLDIDDSDVQKIVK